MRCCQQGKKTASGKEKIGNSPTLTGDLQLSTLQNRHMAKWFGAKMCHKERPLRNFLFHFYLTAWSENVAKGDISKKACEMEMNRKDIVYGGIK